VVYLRTLWAVQTRGLQRPMTGWLTLPSGVTTGWRGWQNVMGPGPMGAHWGLQRRN
jgi:hypothetical protein